MSKTLTENYISLDQAANYLGVKSVTLRNWLKKDGVDLPAHKIGKMWKFKKTEIDEWVNSGKSDLF